MLYSYSRVLVLAAVTGEILAFTSPLSRRNTNHNLSSHFHSSLHSSSSPGGNEDLSGGIFFDGPSDFKVDTSQMSLKGQGGKSTSNLMRVKKPSGLKTMPKDVVIIGAGLAGLSAALHISLNSNRQVTILDKEDPMQQMKKTTAGSFAAAGMLAPQSERLPSGPLLDLCLNSRDMYSEFVQTIESITSNCGDDARKYLWSSSRDADIDESGLEPWEVGYAATGGFLAPAFAGDSVATWSPPAQTEGSAIWLDEVQVHEMEPSLHPEVIGGWWFPEDASVDARRLTCALRAACVERGVQFMSGEGCAAGSLELGAGTCKGVKLVDGRILSANSVIVANGAWMRNLLPVPITPHKGQSFSVRMPSDTEPVLSRVLFAQDTYIVPKADGRIVVGATVEAGSFDPNVTPAGLMHCMSNAMQLVPGLGDLPVEETWAGLRPTTPDKGPILGRTTWDNLFIAGGYWRNGVLLAPKTGQLIGDLVLNGGDSLDDEDDEVLLEAFKWDRFTVRGGGKALAANARYAASMHPVHKRSSGIGVAAAVGTELGFYSGASDAAEERKRDRESLFGNIGMTNDEEDAFEIAAKQGMADSTAFSYSSSVVKPRSNSHDHTSGSESSGGQDGKLSAETTPFDGSPDALTVGSSRDSKEEEKRDDDLESLYDNIRKNKTKSAASIQMNETECKEKTDPGFRIYHVDSTTREVTEVPPYSSPKKSGEAAEYEEKSKDTHTEETDLISDGYDATSFDGYQTIQKANQRGSREEELDAMRQSRISNRFSASSIDESKIGFDVPTKDVKVSSEPTPTENSAEMNDDEVRSDGYDETTFDGYQTIQKANGSSSREEELESMRKARMSNRVKTSLIDESKIGVFALDVNKGEKKDQGSSTSSDDLSDVYSQIQANKQAAVASNGLTMDRGETEEKPDPGFRIYHVDKETGEENMVTPYTSPLTFAEKQSADVDSEAVTES